MGMRPFQAGEGQELNKMLHEAGIIRTDCHVTYVHPKAVPGREAKARFFARYTPTVQVPKADVGESIHNLFVLIDELKPTLIIALGELSLWALTGEMGITKWRGSILQDQVHGVKVIPTYSPDVIIRKWDWRYIAVQDLRRAAGEAAFPEVRIPQWNFFIRPSFTQVMERLKMLLERADAGREFILAGDIETRAGHIACMGIGWSELDAICIPFICVENPEGYWSEEEEIAIVWALYHLFRHPNIKWSFQNGIYDFQYFAVRWGFIPHIYMDTMLAQHTCFAGLPKGLDFQSSIYCKFHRYWKDEGKEFHTSIKTPDEEDKYWVYNCKDCVTTYEITTVHEQNIAQLSLQEPYAFQMAQFMPVLRMMLRGVRCDRERKSQLSMELLESYAEREAWLHYVAGQQLNVRSPKQMMEFFYETLGLPVQKVRKTGRPTANDEALQTLAKKEPLVAPIVQCISEMRSIGVFLSTFVKAPLGEDKRLRSSYNIAGTETYRWSSSKDAFGTGLNLQNIPKGTEK
jgi:uracil-DNA glycosylase